MNIGNLAPSGMYTNYVYTDAFFLTYFFLCVKKLKMQYLNKVLLFFGILHQKKIPI